MSSLLQFDGKIDRQGVHIVAYSIPEGSPSWGDPIDTHTCKECGRNHAHLYTFARKPAGMFGCWVLFRYKGETHAPDLSCPIGIPGKPPVGAVAMTEDATSEYWHS